MTNTAQQRPTRSISSVRNAIVSFDLELDENELIVGTPLVVEKVTTDLTISNISINTVPVTVNDKQVGIGRAVLFTNTSGIVANSPYSIKVTVNTDSTPPQKISGIVIVNVVAD